MWSTKLLSWPSNKLLPSIRKIILYRTIWPNFKSLVFCFVCTSSRKGAPGALLLHVSRGGCSLKRRTLQPPEEEGLPEHWDPWSPKVAGVKVELSISTAPPPERASQSGDPPRCSPALHSGVIWRAHPPYFLLSPFWPHLNQKQALVPTEWTFACAVVLQGYFFFNLFIYFWLCWVFVSVQGVSLVAASGGHSSSRCAGLSLSWPLLLRSTGSRRVGSVVVAHGPSRSAACGILPDQGSNPCPLHRQADSQPLRHQGSPTGIF